MVVVDPREVWLEEYRQKFEMRKPAMKVDFVAMDPTADRISPTISTSSPAQFDCVSCFDRFSLAFESAQSLNVFIENVSGLLRPGGLFIGICPDTSAFWKNCSDAESSTCAKDLFQLTLPDAFLEQVSAQAGGTVRYGLNHSEEPSHLSVYSRRFHLQIEGEEDEMIRDGADFVEHRYLIHFPTLLRVCKENQLEMIDIPNLTQFFHDYRVQYDEQLRPFGVFRKGSQDKLEPAQEEVLKLFAVFVFRKV
jgi:SAM-dependent methyltransferase